MTTTTRTVSINQACEAVGVSRRTVYSWLADNKIQYVRTATGQVRILYDTLFRDGNVPAATVSEGR